MTSEDFNNTSTSRNSSSLVTTPRQDALQDLEITLETVYDDPKGRILFKKYLRQSKNTESLLFLEAVEEYARLRSSQNRYKQLKKILDQFVKVNGKYELNLAASVRASVMKKATQLSCHNCPVDIFEDCVNHVMIQMKEDLWPRFVKTSQFEKYMEIRVKEMKENGGFSSTMTTLCGIDTATPFFSSRDVNTYKNWILGDNMLGTKWNLTVKKKEYQVFLSEKGITADVLSDRKIKAWKIIGHVDIPIEQLTRILISTPLRIRNDGNLQKVTPLDFVFDTNSPYATAITYEKYYMGGFITDREYVLAQSFSSEIYDQEKQLKRHMLIRKSVNHESAPEEAKGGPIRCQALGGFFLEELDNNRTRYYEFGWIDLKGSLPLWLWNRLISSRGGTFHKGIKKSYSQWKAAEEQAKIDELRYSDSAGMLATLDFYESALKRKTFRMPHFGLTPKQEERTDEMPNIDSDEATDADFNSHSSTNSVSETSDCTRPHSVDNQESSTLQFFVF